MTRTWYKLCLGTKTSSSNEQTSRRRETGRSRGGSAACIPTVLLSQRPGDGFVAVGPQRLDTEHRARAVIELDHLARRQQRRITVIACDISIQTHAEPLSEHNRVMRGLGSPTAWHTNDATPPEIPVWSSGDLMKPGMPEGGQERNRGCGSKDLVSIREEKLMILIFSRVQSAHTGRSMVGLLLRSPLVLTLLLIGYDLTQSLSDTCKEARELMLTQVLWTCDAC
ncbi:hypothetical protein EYF80_012287 [Liparis tanakae]|uniref:Uncharacterized protein n=1 Tax=Liparis tanakae TaxID=230148 RepID=A0A4Z2IJY3_9TELE|nr:hypothetical protein EYF80_012287 [Liparis tanakae]